MDKKELAQRYGLDFNQFEKEQQKLARLISIKDSIDFSAVENIGAIENMIVQNKILSVVIVCNKNFEIIEQSYFFDKLRFPYIFDLRAYRELPSMISAFSKLKETPDILLLKGEGINHPRLGIASHFSISAGDIPVIGVDDRLFEGNIIKKDDVFIGLKKTGKVFISKKDSKPLYICPGNKISVETAYDFVKGLIVQPHKMPEPMHLAHKYAREVKKELQIK